MITVSLALRTIYAVCLLGATYTHLTIVLRHGLFWDYGGQPPLSAAFWTLLPFLDPLAAALLFLRPNVGVWATIAIMIADVPHNLWITARQDPHWLSAAARNPFVVSQTLFLLFVLTTAPPPACADRRTRPRHKSLFASCKFALFPGVGQHRGTAAVTLFCFPDRL